MSHYDYLASQDLAEQNRPFYSLIMAAMRQADDENRALLQEAWPEVWDELKARYNAPGGRLEGEAA